MLRLLTHAAMLWAACVPLTFAGLRHVAHVEAGDARFLAIDGDRLLVNDRAVLQVFDIAAPGSPRLVGRSERRESLGAMAFVNHAAYVELGKLGLERRSDLAQVDMGPAKVELRTIASLAPNRSRASQLVFAGGMMVGSLSNFGEVGIMLVDMRDPAHPRVTSTMDTGWAVAPRPPLLFVADGAAGTLSSNERTRTFPGGLQVLDISDPSKPREVGRLGGAALGGTNAEQIAVNGRYVYLDTVEVKSGGWGGADDYIATIDVANPARPVLVGRDKMRGKVHALVCDGARLHVLYDDELEVYSLADPAHPHREDRVAVPGQGWSLVVANGWLYVGTAAGVETYQLEPSR